MIKKNFSLLYDLIVNTFKWNALERGYFATGNRVTRRRDTLRNAEPFKTILSQNTNIYGFSFEAKLQQSITAYLKSKYQDRVMLNDFDDVIVMDPSSPSSAKRRKPLMGIYFGRLLKRSKSNIDILIVTRNGFILVDVKAYKRGFENGTDDKNRLGLLQKSVATMQTQQKLLATLGEGKSYILLMNRKTIDTKSFPLSVSPHLITQQNLFDMLDGIIKDASTNNTPKKDDSFEDTLLNILPKMKQYDTLKVRDLPLLYGEVDKIKIQCFSDYYPSVMMESSTTRKKMIKIQDLLNWQWNSDQIKDKDPIRTKYSVQRVYIRPDSFGGQNIHSISQARYSNSTRRKFKNSKLFRYLYEHLLQYDPAILFQVTTSDRRHHLLPVPARQRACLIFKLGAYGGDETSCQFPLDSVLYLKIGSDHSHSSKY
ncbi:hypothetical protein MP638_000456 [Amoeboaphelidium occidentale]|nr:hypothetical protein MP638_000456 [Amoeboaphelidium occidentale]